jgi:hypothetical protein
MRTGGKGLRVKKFGRKNPIKLKKEAPRFFDNPKFPLQKNLAKTPRIPHPQVTENGFKIRHSATYLDFQTKIIKDFYVGKSLKNDYLKLQVFTISISFFIYWYLTIMSMGIQGSIKKKVFHFTF